MMSFDFRNLEVYKKAKEFHLESIKLLESIKPTNYEKDQLGRASMSIVLNIAEGSGRNYNKEFIQFLGIANGSTFELITQLILAKSLELISEEIVQPVISQLIEVSNMNFSFQKTLKTS